MLDESGVIDSNYNTDRFFVFGGILYNFEHLDLIKKELIPQLESYRKALGSTELKSGNLNATKKVCSLFYGAILSKINSLSQITPVIYILDKKTSFVFDQYYSKSFRYNKLLQLMIEDLIIDKKIDENDTLHILLDEVSLSKKETQNFKNWLVNNVKQVVSVDMRKSENINFIQIADLIAGIPKLKGATPRSIIDDPKLLVLSNCYLHVFPKCNSHEVLGKTNIG